jgi:hypothetical protein
MKMPAYQPNTVSQRVDRFLEAHPRLTLGLLVASAVLAVVILLAKTDGTVVLVSGVLTQAPA